MRVLKPRPQWRHRLKVTGVVLSILFGADLLMMSLKWPFTRKASSSALQAVTRCDITFGTFKQTFFPHPGYVAKDVTFSRRMNGRTMELAKTRRLVFHASWFAMLSLTHRVKRVDLEGLQVDLPTLKSPSAQKPSASDATATSQRNSTSETHPKAHKESRSGIPTTVTDLYASGAVLRIGGRTDKAQALQLDFAELHVQHLAENRKAIFHVRVLNTQYVGSADIRGTVGPLDFKRVSGTELDGSFALSDLNLSTYKALASTLSAQGDFRGTLAATNVRARVTIPDFQVTSSHHTEGISAECHATVDGTKGEVLLRSAAVHFLSSTLLANGKIGGTGEKTTVLDVSSRKEARVQDLLWMFTGSTSATMRGALDLRAHVTIPPEPQNFLRRVRIDGDAEIRDGVFTNQSTQRGIDELSARASDDKNNVPPGDAKCAIGGHVRLRQAIAHLEHAYFVVPDAVASGGGTYNLENGAVDLRGKLATHASLSGLLTGWKSILAIPLDPFFRKERAGSVLTVTMTGTFSHPQVKLQL